MPEHLSACLCHSEGMEAHNKVVLQVRQGHGAYRGYRDLSLEVRRDSSIFGCGYDKVYSFIGLGRSALHL